MTWRFMPATSHLMTAVPRTYPMRAMSFAGCGSLSLRPAKLLAQLCCLPRFQAWLAGLVAFEKARVLKCKVASRTAFDTGLTHRQWPEIG